MTIAVKKSEAEAFADGKMTAEEFGKKARITTYLGDAGTEAGTPFGLGQGRFGEDGFGGGGFFGGGSIDRR